MPVRTTPVAGLLVALAVAASACSGSLGTGSGPTTTAKPYEPEAMCVAGHNAFTIIDELDRTKPDYLDKAKEALKGLDARAPEEIHDDLKAFVDYVQATTDMSQLATLPADLQVSTNRVDAWWKQHCGKPFIGSS